MVLSMEQHIITTEITGAYLDKVERQLFDVFYHRLIEKDRKFRGGFFYTSIRPLCFVVLRIVCVLLIVLTSLLNFMRLYIGGYLIANIALLLFALIVLLLFKDKQKFDNGLASFNQRIFAWSARTHSRTMINRARKAIPFVAEYEINNGLVTYYRIKNEIRNRVWQREINGLEMSGAGFRIWFKNEVHPFPHMILLHEASQPATLICQAADNRVVD